MRNERTKNAYQSLKLPWSSCRNRTVTGLGEFFVYPWLGHFFVVDAGIERTAMKEPNSLRYLLVGSYNFRFIPMIFFLLTYTIREAVLARKEWRGEISKLEIGLSFVHCSCSLTGIRTYASKNRGQGFFLQFLGKIHIALLRSSVVPTGKSTMLRPFESRIISISIPVCCIEKYPDTC